MSERIEDHIGQAVSSTGHARHKLGVAFNAKAQWVYFAPRKTPGPSIVEQSKLPPPCTSVDCADSAKNAYCPT